MKKGLSIHIGLNSIDANHYGSSGTLRCSESDARSMKKIADGLGYNSTLILSAKATYDQVRLSLLTAATQLVSGDMLLLTYSGHGASVKDLNGDEEDYFDESWVLYDRLMMDDDLYEIFSKFQKGVRILVLADCCHSGTGTKFLAIEDFGNSYDSGLRFKSLAPEYVDYALAHNPIMYRAMQLSIAKDIKSEITASVLLISACQDNQLAADGIDEKGNSKFTEILLKVWNSGTFKGGYPDLHKEIRRYSPPTQSPNYYPLGASHPTFEIEQAFLIESGATKAFPDTGNGTNSTNDKIEWLLEVDREKRRNIPTDGLPEYFKGIAASLMTDSYWQFCRLSESIILPKGGEISGGCSASDRGWSCDVRGSIRF